MAVSYIDIFCQCGGAYFPMSAQAVAVSQLCKCNGCGHQIRVTANTPRKSPPNSPPQNPSVSQPQAQTVAGPAASRCGLCGVATASPAGHHPECTLYQRKPPG